MALFAPAQENHQRALHALIRLANKIALTAKKYFDNMSPDVRNQIRYSRGGPPMPLEYVHDKRCPYPCGCWLASPEVNGKAMTKVWKGKGATWKQIKSVLTSWNVPKELEDRFEMATMFDEKSTFVNFAFCNQVAIRRSTKLH